MTPDKGWSIDVQRRRRIGLILPIVLLTTPFAAVNVQAAGYDPASDVNSMASTADYTGAQAWWAAGYTGQGVDVALIDSGVAPVQGLNSAGKVISGPDLSLESQAANLANLDTFGHGTFMAGLIAGRDATLTAPYEQAPASAYRGMAPDARIVSIKVATADGGTDVSQVIAAIDWVVKHRNDNGMNIRVLNLSYGTNSSQYYAVDPLAYAVEQAWDAGIVVVAAAGNSGYQTRGSSPALADPAYDKRIIAVGASDSMGTMTITDDTMPDFSAAAKTGSARAPDFVAPGVHIQGLRVLNSWIDTNIDGKTILDDRFMRGSGTSESAAITSGAVALILSKFPNATPAQVKKMLKDAAYDMPTQNSRQVGSGEMRLAPILTTPLPVYSQGIAPATGGGSLELARGSDHLTRDGVVLKGEQDIFAKPFNAAAMAILEAAGTAWSGGMWNGSVWTGSSWSGSSWSGSSWSGSSWSGSSWSGSSWSGNSWSGNSWSGNSWSGSSWSGNSWSGNSWSTATWS
ncbi:MAG: peptidase S8 and S53 subtilisin kexin sedolisin [Chloroflexi bacterium]|nr:MAG: peptidase S8 and S53 subtilisin kexin sedolisin [Chloroflexota bacterium]